MILPPENGHKKTAHIDERSKPLLFSPVSKPDVYIYSDYFVGSAN